MEATVTVDSGNGNAPVVATPLGDILNNVYDMKHEYLPKKQTPMSDLYDQWIDAPVRLLDGRTGVVCGVDPRPRHAIDDRATKEGEYLYIRLDNPGPSGRPVTFELAENVRRLES